MPGTLFVVATPIGNLEDITARALRILREVALIAAEDTRRTSHLLARYSINTPTTSLHQHNEHRKTSAVVDRLMHGENVALVSDAGTPVVSDPGQHLIKAAADAGIRVEPIPGPSAVMAALAASGFPADAFTFLGFPPVRSKDRAAWFKRLRTLSGTVIFFEAPHRIRPTLKELLGQIGDQPAVVCRELTKVHETLVRGPISSVIMAPHQAQGELTVVISIGHSPKHVEATVVTERDLAIQFGEITESEGLTKRKAINVLARRHGRPPNEIYRAVERGRKLVE
jgi:16S rRNA (cytidine1402-2'-O)-methyltransferase